MDDVTGQGRHAVGIKHIWRETLSGPALAHITALAHALAQFLLASPIGQGPGAIYRYRSHQEKRLLLESQGKNSDWLSLNHMPTSEPITVARDLAIVLIFYCPTQWLKTDHSLLSRGQKSNEGLLLEGWDGVGDGRGVQEGGDIRTPVAGSCWYVAEANTMLYSKCPNELKFVLNLSIVYDYNLVGCGPWGREELDTTERLHFHFSLSCIGEGNGNPLQCSCLENPKNGGAWWAAVYGSQRVGHD